MDNTKETETVSPQEEPTKPTEPISIKQKKPLSEDRLQKLAKAREVALKKRLENAKITKKEKELKKLMYQKRLQDVDAKLENFKKEAEIAQHEAHVNPPSEEEEEEEDEIIEVRYSNAKRSEALVKKPKNKVKKRIIEVSSSSSSESEDETMILKRHYKNKYKNKYGVKPEEKRDVIKETAQEIIKGNVNKELRRLALSSVFPDY